MLTSPVHVLDLGFALPLGILGAVWLWQRKGWGYLLTGLMLSMMTIETASIAIDQFFGHLSDPSASVDARSVICGAHVGWFGGCDRIPPLSSFRSQINKQSDEEVYEWSRATRSFTRARYARCKCIRPWSRIEDVSPNSHGKYK